MGLRKRSEPFLVMAVCAGQMLAQTQASGDYRLALPDSKGQLGWSIDGFRIVENSAKPNGTELGVRGRDTSGQVNFLGFLFSAPDVAPMTGAKCRDFIIAREKKADATLKITRTLEIPRPGGLPVALVEHTTKNRDSSTIYRVRGFVAAADLCGDLEFYSSSPISDEDANLKDAFLSYRLDSDYTPQFSDVTLYAQILFGKRDYGAAAPMFEKALTMVPSDGAPFRSAVVARRVIRDQAGMSYGISGDLAKARSIFEAGTAKDPEYPMYYYNLACADAGEDKLADAKVHLQKAFDRKANVNPGEAMPVPTEDDSFLSYKGNKEFWAFLERLERGK
jgi:tetratricopeptide (TPR) repeat protein